jgi:hypothetical protein
MGDINYYHEKQWLGHCAVHTLNNLFQFDYFTYKKLRKISNQLYSDDQVNGNLHTCSMNPYHSQIPYLGYFDISCIVLALKYQDCEIVNHIIQSPDVDGLEFHNSPLVIGFILNVNTSSLLGLWNSRHWYAIIYDQERKIFINLDSQISQPQLFSNETQFRQFLKNEIHQNQAQIFVVSKIEFTGGDQS